MKDESKTLPNLEGLGVLLVLFFTGLFIALTIVDYKMAQERKDSSQKEKTIVQPRAD